MQNSLENTCARDCNFIKRETPAQVFSCEFWEIFKNTFIHRTPLVAASDSAWTLNWWNSVYKCKKVTNFVLSQENKTDITVWEFVFRYTVNSCAHSIL